MATLAFDFGHHINTKQWPSTTTTQVSETFLMSGISSYYLTSRQDGARYSARLRRGRFRDLNIKHGRYDDHWAEFEHFLEFPPMTIFRVAFSPIYIMMSIRRWGSTPFRTPFTKREDAQRGGMLANFDRSESKWWTALHGFIRVLYITNRR